MAEHAREGRRFAEDEVAEIFRRASDLQKKTHQGQMALSAVELERIAAEAGIDPSQVRAAIAEMDAKRSGRGALLGGPLEVRLERVVPGEIAKEMFEPLIDEIRAAMGEIGQVAVLERSFTWSSPHRGTPGPAEIIVSSRDGQTTIRVNSRHGQFAGGMFGGLMGGLAGGFTPMTVALTWQAAHSPLLSVAAGLGVVGAVYGLARTIFGTVTRKREAMLREVVERLAAAVEKHTGGR